MRGKLITIEDILPELRMRFGGKWNWRTAKFLYDASKHDDINSGEYAIYLDETSGWNLNGQLYKIINNRIVWGVADIQELPENWVIERNLTNPNWKLFEEWSIENGWFDETTLNIEHRNFFSRDTSFSTYRLLDIALKKIKYQYLSLEQWVEFYINIPNEGELCVFSNSRNNHK